MVWRALEIVQEMVIEELFNFKIFKGWAPIVVKMPFHEGVSVLASDFA